VVGVCAAPSVVDDLDHDLAARLIHVDPRRGGFGVLADVGQALADHVIGRDLGRIGDPAVDIYLQPDWHRSSGGKRFQCDSQAMRAEDGRVQAAGNIAKFSQ